MALNHIKYQYKREKKRFFGHKQVEFTRKQKVMKKKKHMKLVVSHSSHFFLSLATTEPTSNMEKDRV